MNSPTTPVSPTPSQGPRPRRRSIFGGLFFIVVGVFFLMANLRADIRVWDWFATYWPALLILWGFAKLIDYFAARSSGEAPPRTFSGGEIFLLILLILFGGAVSGAIEVNRRNPELVEIFGPWGGDWWGEEFTFSEEVKAAEPVKAGAMVRVTNYRGDVSIHPEDIPEIRVVVKKAVRAMNDAEADRIAKSTTVQVISVPSGYEVKPERKDEGYRRVRINMEVHVPRQVSVEVSTDRGGVQVVGVTGNVTANANRGDIEIRSVSGEVRADLRGGNVRIQDIKGQVRIGGRGSEIEVADVTGETVIQGEFYGPIRASKVGKEVHFVSQRSDLTISQLPGRMEMGSGQLEIYDTPGNVICVTRNKDIVLENVGGRIRIENHRGNIEARLRAAPKEEIDISNESGRVELVLPANASFEITATSRQGEVDSDFTGPDLKSTSDRRTSTLQGTVGTKGPRIQLKTTYGGVRIRKAG
jgi:DUF4097 and DUF4098 domain-containing protein YvlB